jgi:hypothetical protein
VILGRHRGIFPLTPDPSKTAHMVWVDARGNTRGRAPSHPHVARGDGICPSFARLARCSVRVDTPKSSPGARRRGSSGRHRLRTRSRQGACLCGRGHARRNAAGPCTEEPSGGDAQGSGGLVRRHRAAVPPAIEARSRCSQGAGSRLSRSSRTSRVRERRCFGRLSGDVLDQDAWMGGQARVPDRRDLAASGRSDDPWCPKPQSYHQAIRTLLIAAARRRTPCRRTERCPPIEKMRPRSVVSVCGDPVGIVFPVLAEDYGSEGSLRGLDVVELTPDARSVLVTAMR